MKTRIISFSTIKEAEAFVTAIDFINDSAISFKEISIKGELVLITLLVEDDFMDNDLEVSEIPKSTLIKDLIKTQKHTTTRFKFAEVKGSRRFALKNEFFDLPKEGIFKLHRSPSLPKSAWRHQGQYFGKQIIAEINHQIGEMLHEGISPPTGMHQANSLIYWDGQWYAAWDIEPKWEIFPQPPQKLWEAMKVIGGYNLSTQYQKIYFYWQRELELKRSRQYQRLCLNRYRNFRKDA